jgi:hypothetical protein
MTRTQTAVSDHDHSHTHDDHPHQHEAGTPPAGGPVVVDIGDDVGALVVRVGRSRLGQELHVRREGEQATTHTGIWERSLGDQSVVVAVFPALIEGRYAILDRADAPVVDVTIVGGQVTELELA